MKKQFQLLRKLSAIIEEIFWNLSLKDTFAFQSSVNKNLVADPRIWESIRRRILKQGEKRIAREKLRLNKIKRN